MAEFILIFRRDKKEFTKSYEESKADAVPEIGKKWYEWMSTLEKQGKVLRPYQRISKGSKIIYTDGSITDGPYAEIKECFAGFYLIQAANFNEATEIARKCPNLIQDGTVEVRQFIEHNDQVS
jgi:hypothetical protein